MDGDRATSGDTHESGETTTKRQGVLAWHRPVVQRLGVEDATAGGSYPYMNYEGVYTQPS